MNFKTTNVFQKNWAAYHDDKIRFIVNSGGSRSSKTYSILQLFAILLLQNNNFKISCYRNRRVDSIDTMGQDFENILRSIPGLHDKFRHNKKEAMYTCKRTNSFISFQGTELVHKALGQGNDIIFLNEVSEFSEDVFRQLNQRTRHKVFLDFNPSGESFIDKYKNNPTALFLHSTYKDNPFLTEGIIETLEGYNPYEEGSVYLNEDLIPSFDGKPITDEWYPPPHPTNHTNGTADKFMYFVYCLGVGAERPNRVYRGWTRCTPEFFTDLEYQSYYGLDFGITSPTALVEVKYDGDRTIYVRQRMYKPSSKMGMPIYEYIRTRVSPRVSDDDIIVADSAKNSMVDDLRYGGLSAVAARKGPGSKYRMITQLQSFRVVYTTDSEDLHDEFLDLEFKKDRRGNVTDDLEDRNNDHLLDALAYVVDYLVGYLGITFN